MRSVLLTNRAARGAASASADASVVRASATWAVDRGKIPREPRPHDHTAMSRTGGPREPALRASGPSSVQRSAPTVSASTRYAASLALLRSRRRVMATTAGRSSSGWSVTGTAETAAVTEFLKKLPYLAAGIEVERLILDDGSEFLNMSTMRHSDDVISGELPALSVAGSRSPTGAWIRSKRERSSPEIVLYPYTRSETERSRFARPRSCRASGSTTSLRPASGAALTSRQRRAASTSCRHIKASGRVPERRARGTGLTLV